MFKTFLGCWINYYDLDQLPWNFFMIGFICHVSNEVNWYILHVTYLARGFKNAHFNLGEKCCWQWESNRWPACDFIPSGANYPWNFACHFFCSQRGLRMTQINSQLSKKLSVYATKMEPFKRPWTRKLENFVLLFFWVSVDIFEASQVLGRVHSTIFCFYSNALFYKKWQLLFVSASQKHLTIYP